MLELLQHVVDREPRVGVVEPDDEADRDPVRLALAVHRIDPRAAELLVLRAVAQRPAERVDHAVQRLLDLPDLLDAERPDLRVRGGEPELLERGAREMAPAALGEHGRAGHHVRAGLEVRLLAAGLVAALVARADADDRALLDQQLRADGLGQDVRAGLLRLLPQPAVELGHGDDVVAVVAERRRGRLERQRPLAVEHPVDGLLAHLAEAGPGVVVREAASRIALGFITPPESWCAPATRPFSITATGTSPSDSVSSGSSSSSWSSRIAQARPACPPPTMATPTSMRSSSASVGGPTNSPAGSTGGGNSLGATGCRPLPLDISRPCGPSRPR